MSKARQRAQAHYEMRRETIRLHHARQRYEQATSEIEHKSVRRRPCRMVAIALFLVAALVVADFAQARGGGGRARWWGWQGQCFTQRTSVTPSTEASTTKDGTCIQPAVVRLVVVAQGRPKQPRLQDPPDHTRPPKGVRTVNGILNR